MNVKVKRNRGVYIASLLPVIMASLLAGSCASGRHNPDAEGDGRNVYVKSYVSSFDGTTKSSTRSVSAIEIADYEGQELKLIELEQDYMEGDQEGDLRGTMIDHIKELDNTITSMFGYASGSSFDAINNTANFVDNAKKGASGELKKPDGSTLLKWDSTQPYTQFAAMYPEVKSATGHVSQLTRSGMAFSFDYTVPTNCADQKDLLFGFAQPAKYETGKVAPKVEIALKHALVAVNFKVGKSAPNKSIKSIVLEDAGSQATCKAEVTKDGVNKFEWTNKGSSGTRGKYTLTFGTPKELKTPGEVVTGGSNGNRDNHTFFVIPRDANKQDVTFTISYTDGTFLRAHIPAEKFKGWKAGYTYTYLLTDKKTTHVFSVDKKRHELTIDNAKKDVKSESSDFTLTSLRVPLPNDPTAQYTGHWKVIKYKYEGKVSDTAPAWFSLNKTEGNGTSAEGEKLTGTFNPEAGITTDYLAMRNQELRTAAKVTDKYLGGEPGKEATANCYIISAQGTYKLPLVYGNALLKGATNSSAYTINGSTNFFPTHNYKLEVGTYTFNGKSAKKTVYKDQDYINTPWIKDQKDSTGSNTEYTPSSAEIVWCDINGATVVKDLKVSGDQKYLTFEVTDQIQNGNAVVAVKNRSGKILWSWHLWFTVPQTLVQVGNGEEDYVLSENVGMKYTTWRSGLKSEVTVVIQQLGSNLTQEVTFIRPEIHRIKGTAPFYQAFRKEPLPLGDNPTGTYSPCMQFQTKDKNDPPMPIVEISFGYAIQNPKIAFYQNDIAETGQNFCWTNVNYENKRFYWRSPSGDKTVYDPSPVGVKMPTYEVLQKVKTKFSSKKTSLDQVHTLVSGDKEYYLPDCGSYWGGNRKVFAIETQYMSADKFSFMAGVKGQLKSQYVTSLMGLWIKGGRIQDRKNQAKNGTTVRPMKDVSSGVTLGEIHGFVEQPEEGDPLW